MAINGKIPLEGWLDDEGYVSVCKPQGSWKDWKDTTPTARYARDWEEYKSTLPECVQEILKGCTEVERRDKQGLLEILQSETRVLNICSDGGHIDNRGSYGWVIASAGSVIYKGKGHALGHPMSSYIGRKLTGNWLGYSSLITTANVLASPSTAPSEATATTWR
jgi:hypothetical protein